MHKNCAATSHRAKLRISVSRALLSRLPVYSGLGYYMDQPLEARLAAPKPPAHAALASSSGPAGVIESAVETAGGALQGGAGIGPPPTARPNRLEQVGFFQMLSGSLVRGLRGSCAPTVSQSSTSHLQCALQI